MEVRKKVPAILAKYQRILVTSGGLVRGSITVDGHPKVHETFRRVASYVEQVCTIKSPQQTTLIVSYFPVSEWAQGGYVWTGALIFHCLPHANYLRPCRHSSDAVGSQTSGCAEAGFLATPGHVHRSAVLIAWCCTPAPRVSRV